MRWKSRKFYQVVMGGVVLYCSMSTAMAAVACSGPALNSPCSAGAKPVSETPSGVIDGRNPTFTLRSLPLPEWPVRVFDNGIEENITQYRVAGQSVTFLPTAVPVPGDVINVFYFVQKPVQSSIAAPIASPSQGAISTVLLKHAANREIAHLLLENAPTVTPASIAPRPSAGLPTNARIAANAATPTIASVPTNAGSPANVDSLGNANLSASVRTPASVPIPAVATEQNGRTLTVQRTVDQPRSLIMLAQVLRSTEDTTNNTDPLVKRKAREVSVDGVEGLGDSHVPSPYDYLTQSEDSELDGLLRKPSSNQRSVRGKHTSFASMRMLVRRLTTQ